MFRIDAAHLCWVLEELVAGRVVNRITVDDERGRVGPGGAATDARHFLARSLRPAAQAHRPLRTGRVSLDVTLRRIMRTGTRPRAGAALGGRATT